MNILHVQKDGQVFAVDQLSENEFQTIYPDHMADKSYTYMTFSDAINQIRADLDDLGIIV